MANPTTTSSPPTVFVLDGDSIVRSRIANLAQTMQLRCEPFASGQDFLDTFDLTRPGCLVTEVRTPVVSGLEVQRRLAMQESSLPVIFLSAHGTVPLIVRAMRLGAINFLEKPPDEHELWEAIQEGIQEDAMRRQVKEKERPAQEMIASLEPHERLMLELIGQGTALREVAGYLGVSVRTVEIRRRKLMQKVNADSYVELLRFAFTVLDTDEDGNGEASVPHWSGSNGSVVRARSMAVP